MSGNHYRLSNHQMDDAELIKQEALRSKKRRQTLSKALFQLMCFLCIAIIAFQTIIRPFYVGFYNC